MFHPKLAVDYDRIEDLILSETNIKTPLKSGRQQLTSPLPSITYPNRSYDVMNFKAAFRLSQSAGKYFLERSDFSTSKLYM